MAQLLSVGSDFAEAVIEPFESLTDRGAHEGTQQYQADFASDGNVFYR